MRAIKPICIVFLLTGKLAWAATGTLHGKVTVGPGRVAIGQATVTLRTAERTVSTVSDDNGEFTFPSVEEGSGYSLTVEGQGLAPMHRDGIAVTSQANAEIDAHAELANLHSDVVVTDGVVDLESTGNEISQTITANEISETPSVTRSAAKYALLDPHVRQTLGLGANYDDSNRLSINAGSYRHTSYELDGLINYDWVYAVMPAANVAAASVDDVKVLTGSYPAQFGNSTNGIIAIDTKSGSETTHGDYFAYLRPSGIQADPVLAPYHIPNQRLDWGASQGGPLLTPSTRYFASYERVQADRGAALTSPTPGFFDGRSNQYSGLVKLDHDLSAGNVVTLRLNGDHYATNNADDRVAGINNPTYGRTARTQSWGGQIADQAVLGKAVNIARFAYTNYTPDSATPLVESAGVSVPNYLQAGYSTFSWVHAQSEQAADTFAFNHGAHSVKLGGELQVLRVKDFSYSPLGTYSYHTAASFLAQQPYQYQQTFGTAYVHYGQQAFNLFAEDDIKLRPNVNLDLGLRYEYQSITTSTRNFGPRLGVSWDVRGDGQTVLRASGGVYFDQYYMYLNRRFLTLGPNSPQFNYTWDCTATPDPCPTYPNAAAVPSGGSQSRFVGYLYVPGNQLLNPYAMQFSASVQQQLAKNTVLTISGLEVHTLKQMRVYDLNHPAPFIRTQPGQVRSVAAANATRPFTSYAGVNNVSLVDQIDNTGASIYQSLDASVTQQLGRWGRINGHYVFSASYAYSEFYADYNSGVPSEWLPNYDKSERGPSDFFQRHRFIADAVLNTWYKTTLAVVGTFGSGLPVNPVTGVDNNGDGYTVDRPVGLARDSFRTPPQSRVDVSLGKDVPLHERLNLDLRVQAFNVFNTQSLVAVNNIYGNGATPIASFLAPLAGITNSDPSRQLEGVVRLRF